MITAVNMLSSGLFALFMGTFHSVNPWIGMAAVSLVTALVLLLVFKAFGNKRVITRKKARLVAAVLELALFKDDPVLTLKALGRALAANAAYVASLLVPMLASLVPMVLILAQMDAWFGSRPVKVAESVILRMTPAGDVPLLDPDCSVSPSPGLEVSAGPVRIPARNEVCWRLTARQAGAHWVDIRTSGATMRKSVLAGDGLAAISVCRTRGGPWARIVHPLEEPLGANSPVETVCVDYPAPLLAVGGIRIHWLAAFCALSLLFALALRKPMGVAI